MHLFNHQTHHRGQAHACLSILTGQNRRPLIFLFFSGAAQHQILENLLRDDHLASWVSATCWVAQAEQLGCDLNAIAVNLGQDGFLFTFWCFGRDRRWWRWWRWCDELQLTTACRNWNVPAVQRVYQLTLRSLSDRQTLHGVHDPIDRGRRRKIRCLLCKCWRRHKHERKNYFFHSNLLR